MKREKLVDQWIIGKQADCACSSHGAETSCSQWPFIHITWDVLDHWHWLKINFLIKLLHEQMISHSCPADAGPVFWLTPLEVSVTLMWAHRGVKMSWRAWMGSRGSLLHAPCSTMAPRWKASSVSCLQQHHFLYFVFTCSVPLSVLSSASQPGMSLTCLCNLHKLASEICLPVCCSVRMGWLFKRNI